MSAKGLSVSELGRLHEAMAGQVASGTVGQSIRVQPVGPNDGWRLTARSLRSCERGSIRAVDGRCMLTPGLTPKRRRRLPGRHRVATKPGEG